MKGHIQKEYKKRAKHRLRIIEGQVRGLEKMIEDEAYCIAVMHQALAVQESLKSFTGLMLKNHLKTHVGKQLVGKDKEKAIAEMLQLYKVSNK